MCGIVAYVGHQNCESILLSALSHLEYRGYDSAGMAFILKNQQLVRLRAKGNLFNLSDKLLKFQMMSSSPIHAQIGIAHTRWATHGEANEMNAHPHVDNEGRIAVVQNGIVHNYLAIKSRLSPKVKFESHTDTEVIAHLIAFYQNEKGLDITNAIRNTINDLEGDLALAILSVNAPNEIFVYSRNTPLIIGKCSDGYWCASDLVALNACEKYMRLPNDTLAKISAAKISAEKLARETQITEAKWEAKWHRMPVLNIQKQGYDSYMLKEVFEQPKIIANIARWDEAKVKGWKKGIKSVQLIAAGSSWHAALIGQYVLEKKARLTTRVWVASEYVKANPPLSACSLTLAISQSGETADVLNAVKWERKRRKEQNCLYQCPIIAITNRKESTLAQYVNEIWPMNVGVEMAVAATKSFVATLMMLYKLAGIKTEELLPLASEVEHVLRTESTRMREMAEQVIKFPLCIFMGRGLLWPIAMEASLKLTEVANLASLAYAAGEMKHGYLALLSQETLVICLSCADHQVEEIEARGASVMRLDLEGEQIHVAIKTLVCLQMLSYYAAKLKGLDVDRPRHLAKSVTVF
jgi:glucosamine--fructose-6-phosphate aminotransferase (isomerizing)